MRLVRNWIILIIFAVILSVILFITGRQHSVYVDNKNKGEYVALKEVKYSLDGDKEKKIKAKKRKAEVVKGRSHKIEVQYKDTDGQNKKIEKKFELKATENVIINLPELINNGEKWIEEFDAK